MQPQIGPPILQQPPAPIPFDFAAFIRRTGGNTTHHWPQYEKLMHICHLDPFVVYSERAGEAVRLTILHIAHILHILLNYHFCHRLEVLKQRAPKFSRSHCETFAFATSETVSIASGNRLIQAVGNMSVLHILHILHV
jgi:hypothetical protein